MRIKSPYRPGATSWLRGNLHTHTSASDGPFSPQDTVRRYAEKGYDFLMLSDHDGITPHDGIDPHGLVLIMGNEITGNGPHMLHVGCTNYVAPDRDRQAVLDAIAADTGFGIMCHPNWEAHFNHCPQERLEQLQGYAGIEIFNGVCTWVEGNPVATDRWDRLLSAGRRIWGFANDDCHVPTDLGVAWNVVQAESRDAASIVDALRHGRFYASTGVAIERIEMVDGTVHVRAPEAGRICVYSDFKRRPAYVDGPEITFTLPRDFTNTYFRFECFGCGDKKAWTQPFFVSEE